MEKNQRAVLAHWTYNREEWVSFIRWHKLRRGRLYYLIYYFLPKKKAAIPEVTITMQNIWIDDAVESFNDVDRHLKHISLHEAGTLNILEITYVVLKDGLKRLGEIKVPVPKGKLMEAIQVQESLVNRPA
jgi:hypothetical protein